MEAGDRFNFLTVVSRPEKLGGKVEVKCDCGVVKFVDSYGMRSGAIKSCGCYGRSVRQAAKFRHGHGTKGMRSPEYNVWANMISRCCYEKHTDFYLYGGRGITVCDAWKDFKKFFEDVGKRPANHTLDRIDVNKGYEPGNVRWATLSEQARNKRTNRVLAIGDKSMCVADWVDETGLSSSLIINRIEYLGWSVEKALTTPARLNKRQKVKL